MKTLMLGSIIIHSKYNMSYYIIYIVSITVLSLLLLYPPIDSNNITTGIQMVDVLERIDAESNEPNPAKANLEQSKAENSAYNPRQGTSSVIQPGLHLWKSFIMCTK